MTENTLRTSARSASRRGNEYTPAPAWHNLAFGLFSVAITFGVLMIPGVTYVDMFLGVEGVAVLVFMLLLVGGLFQGVLPFARQHEKQRYRRR